jgi:ribosomal protein L37AE/L43A
MKPNMFGCLPCPKCGSKFRWPTQSGVIVCDDCGFTEPSPAKEDA